MLPLEVLSLPLECLPGAWFSPGPIPDSYNEPDIFGKSGIFQECLIKYLTVDVGRVYRWTKLS